MSFVSQMPQIRRCPAMSGYVQVCPQNGTEILTFRHQIFFSQPLIEP